MATKQKYYDEELKQLTADVNEMAAQRKKNDAAAKAQYDQGVDTAAQTASGVYQQRIDEAPAVFQEQYDANHINELISRKKVQESMANMGLTDSGLNRSQQTALSVQRGNADAATRQQQQAYVTAARQAIDQIMAEAATKKQQYGASVDQATNNWMTEAMLSARQTADTNANARVIADQEAETARIKAQYEAMIDAAKNGLKYDEKTGTYYKDTSGDVKDLALTLYKESGDWEGALTQAAAFVNGGSVPTGTNTAALDTALSGITNWNASSGFALFDKARWTGPEGDGKNVYEDIIQEQLKKSAGWLKLTQEQRDIATAIAIGKSVGTTWTSQSEGNKTKNDTRIKSALKAAGFEEEYHNPGEPETAWETLYTIATNYYNATY